MLAVKEIFNSFQAEGYHAGKLATFVRFAGCNLWDGTEDGRARGAGPCSQWCDTDFAGTDGTEGGMYTGRELAKAVADIGHGIVVLTGGEPLLQLNKAEGIRFLDATRRRVHLETNGTLSVRNRGLYDWITVSPKPGTRWVLREANEVKLVVPQAWDPHTLDVRGFDHWYVQPLDGHPGALADCLEVMRRDRRWSLSLQTNKFVGMR